MRPDFLNVQVGDVVAVSQPGQKAYLAQVLYVEGGARFSDPNFLQVCREPDCAVMNICPSWITQRLPRGPEPEPQDLTHNHLAPGQMGLFCGQNPVLTASPGLHQNSLEPSPGLYQLLKDSAGMVRVFRHPSSHVRQS